MYIADQTLDGLLAILWIGQGLHKPEFAMLHKLGIETTSGYQTAIGMEDS